MLNFKKVTLYKQNIHESFDKYVSVDELDDEGQEIFKSGMEALLAVIRQVEMTDASKEIKKH